MDELIAPDHIAPVKLNTLLPPVPDHPSNAKYWWHDPHYLEESKHACCAEA